MAGKYSFKSTYNELYTLEEEYNDLEKKLNDSNIKYEILKKKYDRDISIKDKLESTEQEYIKSKEEYDEKKQEYDEKKRDIEKYKSLETKFQGIKNIQQSIIKFINSINANKTQIKNSFNELTETTKSNTNNKKDENQIYIKNVKTMLELLFPNSFPTLNNIKDSFSMVIDRSSDDDTVFTWKNIYPSFLTQNKYPDQYYSYLQIDGKIYTTTQLIWLNDIFNHPKYKELFDKYEFFILWKSQQKDTLQGDLSKKQELFDKDFGKDGRFEITEDDKQFFKENKYATESVNRADKNFIERMDLNNNLDGIYDNIEDIMSYITVNTKPKELYKRILDAALAIRTLYKKVSDKIIIKKDIENKITRLISSISEINAIMDIKSKYIDADEIILNYETEEKSTLDELKDKYPEYIEFVDLFKTFVRPKRNTTNQTLQNIIEGFATGEKDNFANLIKPPTQSQEEFKNKCTELNILQTKANEPRFEIYIQLNLIAGQLNDKNRSRINCMYKSEYLGTELDHILHPSKKPWELSTKRLFFDLADFEKKTKEKQKEQKQKESAVSIDKMPPPPPPQPNGAPEKKAIMPPMPLPPIDRPIGLNAAAAAAGGKSKSRKRELPIYPLRKTKRKQSN